MAVDTIQFVDSIASSPTVRLDINDGTTWRTTSFAAPPPRLRRAMSQNAMRDGINVSSSAYDSRTITLGLTLVHTTEDNKATELQKLARELDRADNFLRYQPSGATKPVFFRLYRSDMSQLEQFTGTPSAIAKPTIELLAEPFFLGLRETLGPFTVNNDPAAGSNGHYFDVTGVIGDVAAPCVLSDSVAERGFRIMAARQHGTPSSLVFFSQAESMTLGTDTTNPGGGPDAAMSGTGANNFVRTSFATASMQTRLTWNPTDAETRGTFRLIAVVRRSDSTSVINVRTSAPQTNSAVATALSTSRQILDLGLVSGTGATPTVPGYGSAQISPVFSSVNIQAERVSGAGTIDWDYAALVPADEWQMSSFMQGTTVADLVIDAVQEQVYRIADSTVLFTTGATESTSIDSLPVAGGFPRVVPDQTNRFYWYHTADTVAPKLTMGKASLGTITVDYWPRYMFVRPSAT